MLKRMTAQRRRILMTVDAIGGVWQYAIALSQQLVGSGDDVVLAGLGPHPNREQKRQAEAIATLEWLRSPPEWMARKHEELDGLAHELAELVHDHAITLVQVNEPGQARQLDLACPVVAVSHSCIVTWFRAVRGGPPPRDWAWHGEHTRAGIQRADLLVAPSASHAAALAECYGSLPRLIVVHNAVSRPARTRHRDDIVFGAARWWDDGKNGRVLDEAASLTAWPIFVAGSTTGPDGHAIIFRNVISLGALPNTETRNLAGRCGAFVSPSLYEPFGLATLEAATAGTPLVLADIPAYRELWSDAAVFFSPRDAESLAEQLNRLASNPSLRSKLGAAALRRARSYTPQKQLTAMHRAYDKATATLARRL